MDMRGHNSAASRQTLSELAGTLDGKLPKRRFPYFKFYPRDWIEATRSMTLEERGAYIDFICLFMESEGDLQDDDDWIRHQMHVPKQRWRKVKKSLIRHGKISVEGSRLVNERCLRELDELIAKSAQNSKNVRKRWGKVGEKFEKSSEKVERKLKESSNKVETFLEENSEKTNEINDCADTNVSRHARVISDSDSDKERYSPPLVPPQGKKPKRKMQMPTDWTPSPELRAWARNGTVGATDSQIDDQFEHFRDYHLARASTFADWSRAFQTWMRNAKSYGRLRGGDPENYSEKGRQRSLLDIAQLAFGEME